MSQNDIFDQFPIIEIGEYVLAELNGNYKNDFFKYINHKKVRAFISENELPKSVEEANDELTYWSNLYKYKSSIYWGILTKSNILIGTCGFNSWSKARNRAEISYDLSYNYWGKGIMSAAIKSISEFGFDRMKLRRIQATVVTDNSKSIKLLEKCNFNREGLMSNYESLRDIQKDSYMYSLTN